MGRPKHFSQRVSPIHMIALILMIAALTRCGGCGPSTPGKGSTPKHGPFRGPHMMGTGQVKSRQSTFEAPNNKEALYITSVLQNGDLSSGEEPMATTPLSQSRVTLQMPTGSFPPNDVLTLIANNFQFKVGDFITVVATPNGDGTFTAQQITKASMSAFQNQVIVYQGTATAAVTCQTTCAGQSISYVIGSTNFSFTMSSDTTVTGFGSPASIAAKQAVDVMVQFKVGASPHVNQVSNPNPASPSTAITPSPSTTIVAFTVQPQIQHGQQPVFQATLYPPEKQKM